MGAVTQSILLELRFSYGNSCFSDLSRLSYGRPCSWGHCSLRNNGSSRHRPVDNVRQGEGSQPPNSLPTPRTLCSGSRLLSSRLRIPARLSGRRGLRTYLSHTPCGARRLLFVRGSRRECSLHRRESMALQSTRYP